MNEINLKHKISQINDARLHVVTSGEGPLFLLIHGFPEYWYSWRHMIPKLAKDYKVLVPDTRGCGNSEVTKTGYDLDTLANDMACLIKKEGQDAVVIGHDWGGVIGWHLASSYPELVKAYITVSGPHPLNYFRVMYTNPRQFLMGLYTLFFQIPFLPEYLLSRQNGELAAKVLRITSQNPNNFTKQDIDEYKKVWQNIESISAGLNYYRQMARKQISIFRSYKSLKVKCPVQVIWADNDRFLSLAQTKGLDKYCELPPRTDIIKNCGHWVAQEKPDELYSLIENFLGNIKDDMEN